MACGHCKTRTLIRKVQNKMIITTMQISTHFEQIRNTLKVIGVIPKLFLTDSHHPNMTENTDATKTFSFLSPEASNCCDGYPYTHKASSTPDSSTPRTLWISNSKAFKVLRTDSTPGTVRWYSLHVHVDKQGWAVCTFFQALDSRLFLAFGLPSPQQEHDSLDGGPPQQ